MHVVIVIFMDLEGVLSVMSSRLRHQLHSPQAIKLERSCVDHTNIPSSNTIAN